MKLLFIVMLLVGFTAISAFQGHCKSSGVDHKRDQLRAAFQKKILSPYDIAFPTYVKLEMWDELTAILKDNLEYALQYTLPRPFLSRPFDGGDAVWVFTEMPPCQGFRFSGNPLELLNIHDEYPFDHPGTIRLIHGRHILFGGGYSDVDLVTVHDTVTGESIAIELMEGHYVHSLLVENDMILAGACGERVNIWSLGDCRFLGSCAANKDGFSDWQTFNRKECISSMHVYNDQVIGAGQTRIYFWDLSSGGLIRSISKHIEGSRTHFFEESWIEYRDLRIAAQSFNDPEKYVEKNAPLPIEDLVVAKSNILPNQSNALVIVSLRGNRGILFYDLDTLSLVLRTDLKGQKLRVAAPYLFATDDRRLYRYSLRNRAPEAFNVFLESVSLDEIQISDDNYPRILELARAFPEVVHPDDLAEKYLDGFGIQIAYRMYYGKIGDRKIAQTPEALDLTEEVYGYKIDLEVVNTSNRTFRLPVRIEWKGRIGIPETDGSMSVYTTQEDIVIGPRERFQKKEIVLGEREPAVVFVYPGASPLMRTEE